MITAFFLSLPHSRTMETEADIVGLNLAADACYDVREAAIFWKMMTVCIHRLTVNMKLC
jgi:Zn-dependent protease with chaperone function